MRPDRGQHPRGVPRDGPRVRRRRTTGRGSSAAAGRWRRSPAARRRRPTSTRSCRTGRCSCPTATTTAPGSTPGRSSSPGSPPRPPTRRTAGSSALPDGSPQGTLHEGAMDAGRAAAAPSCRRPSTPRAARGPASTCSRSGVTAWQDAIVGAYAGMADTGSTYLDAVASGDLRRRRGRRAVVGPRARPRAGRRPRRSAARTQTGGRFRATSIKIMQDGVCENFTAAMLVAVPRPAAGTPTDNAGHSFVDAEELQGGRRRAGRRGLPGARARDRRPGVARGARRVRGRPGRPATAPTCGTTSRTSRSSTPTTCRGSPSSASPPTRRRCGPATSRRWTT